MSRIKILLDKLLERGGQYTSWKNNHEIELALSGESDLDIFVPLKYKSLFLELAKDDNWIPVKNPIADYPDIYHFYSINESLKVFHLHVYFKVITGESWLKEYIFPIDDFLIENSVCHSSGIYILNNKAQSFLFVLRHFTKGKSFFSRILYKKELDSYKEEWELCKSGFDPLSQPEIIDFSPYFSGSGLDNQFDLPDSKTAKMVRIRLKSYLRLPESKLTQLRLNSLKERLLNKLVYKRKKILPVQGFILVFSGADGVGKSTMSETIGNAYKTFLTVKNVQLGRPQSAGIEAVRKLLNRKKKESSGAAVKSESKDKKITLKRALSATYLAYLRYKTAERAKKYRQKNYLVISDRWPTLEYHKMDGPKLSAEKLNGLYRKLALLEKKYYDKLISSDLSIILTVPTDVAVQRNRERIKEGKETDQEIMERHLQNAHHNPKSKEIIRFDNNGELNYKRFELIKLIQDKLYQGT